MCDLVTVMSIMELWPGLRHPLLGRTLNLSGVVVFILKATEPGETFHIWILAVRSP